MLVEGDRLPQQRARGLMWLMLACENAGPEESWIEESYNRAMASASESDSAMALQMLEHWVQGRSANATQEPRPAPPFPAPLYRQTPPRNRFGYGPYGGDFCAHLAPPLYCLLSPDEIEQLPQYPQYIDGPLPPTCSARPYCR
jgi:hypothetical protein